MTTNEHLQEWRNTLNVIDESILLLLGQRYKICRKVGKFKKENNIPMMQPDRIEEVIARCSELGKKVGISEELSKKLYQLIIEYACKLETEIIEE